MQESRPARGNLISVRPRVRNQQISRGRTAFISEHNGEVQRERAEEGLYVYDTRILSCYAWKLNGKRPEFSCGSSIEQSLWIGYFIQAPENCKDTATSDCNPLQQTLELRLTRSVGEGMHEDVHLTNHTQIETDVLLDLEYELAFVSQDEAENGRQQFGNLDVQRNHPEQSVWEEFADYQVEHKYSQQGNEGVAKMRRGIRLRIENASSSPEWRNGHLIFQCHLQPHGVWHTCLSWIAYVEGQRLPLAPRCSRGNPGEWDRKRCEWLSAATSFSSLHSDDLSALVDQVLCRSRLDLADLRMYDLDTPGGIALAAGVPTYMEVFGRDMQAAGWQAATLGPEFLRGSIRVLSKLGATEVNDWRDAQPGRLPHELHTDPLSVLNFRPKSLYFGSVSGCLLLPICVSELWHWTGDLDEVRNHVEDCMRALGWADRYSMDTTGFYRYQTRSRQGVKNQGWKDSEDAIVYPDGSQVAAPIGTSEMQAFAYVAKLHFSELMWRLGHVRAGLRLFTEAQELKQRFNDKFWMEEEGFYAMGIDSKGELIRSVASDAGHCLLAGIIDESRVQSTAARLMREDLFSGWGIRTLSSEHPAFNPFAYHRGTVWPVTNAVFVLAFSRFGLYREMHRLARAIFEAAGLFEHHRLPEVFGGQQRSPDCPFPGMYVRADWPQAWSASAPFLILQALLGLYPYAAAHVLFVNPHLPDWLPEISVENMRVGKATVTLHFSRNAEGKTDFEITELRGPLHIIRQPSPWSMTAGWAERTRDVIESLLPHRRAG